MMCTDIPLRRHMRSLVWFLAFTLLAGAILITTLRGPTIDNSIIPNLDKMAHLVAFGLLAVLLFQFIRSAGFATRWFVPMVTVLIVTALGVMDEWAQSLIPGRIASLGDGLSDVAGAVIAMLLSCRYLADADVMPTSRGERTKSASG